MSERQESIITIARKYFNINNWIPIPCKIFKDKKKNKYLKVPSVKEWQKITSEDWEEKFDEDTKCLGVLTGKPSNIVILDIDCKGDTLKIWKNLIKEHGEINTLIAKTPSGGLHYYFIYNEDLPFKSDSKILKYKNEVLDIDFKTNGGYIVTCPSEYEKGQYEWLSDPFETEIIEFPEWILKYQNKKKEGNHLKTVLKAPNHMNLALLFKEINNEDLICSDCENCIFYILEENNIWKQLKINECKKIVYDSLIDYLTKEIKKKSLVDQNTEIYELMAKLGSDSFLKGIVISLAPRIYNNEIEKKLDRLPHILSFKNGVYDMKKNKFRDRQKEDYLTSYNNFNFKLKKDIDSKIYKKVEQILRQIYNDSEEDYENNKNWLGYCLTGEVSETLFLITIGHKANNAKSTIANIYKTCLPIYFIELDQQTFEKNYKGKRHKQITQLKKPYRYIFVDELTESIQDVDFIKKVVDGVIPNEVLYGTTESIEIQGKLNIASNKDTNFKTDCGIGRRGLEQELTNQFLAKDKYEQNKGQKGIYLRDTKLLEKFNNEDYKNSFINIILPYAVKFYKDGYTAPDSWRHNFENLCDNNDEMSNFIDMFIIKTNHDSDRIHKDEFSDLWNLYYKRKTDFRYLVSDIRRLLNYDYSKRKDNKRGVICKVVFNDEYNKFMEAKKTILKPKNDVNDNTTNNKTIDNKKNINKKVTNEILEYVTKYEDISSS